MQTISAIARFVTIGLIMISCIYILILFPNQNLSKIKMYDFSKIHIVFANVVIINIFHHSIPGIYHPFRPQSHTKLLTIISILSSICFLFI